MMITSDCTRWGCVSCGGVEGDPNHPHKLYASRLLCWSRLQGAMKQIAIFPARDFLGYTDVPEPCVISASASLIS